jgi:hypothetical protein
MRHKWHETGRGARRNELGLPFKLVFSPILYMKTIAALPNALVPSPICRPLSPFHIAVRADTFCSGEVEDGGRSEQLLTYRLIINQAVLVTPKDPGNEEAVKLARVQAWTTSIRYLGATN